LVVSLAKVAYATSGQGHRRRWYDDRGRSGLAPSVLSRSARCMSTPPRPARTV